ncbi:unnamed protein product [Paramecium sonneborni]|uniref:Citrate synthase n=1 Tax=Paramecium sonneborni TaxID=65129 RepID=A0A8S1RBT5_9CILI|nr:unnamed protein product [Paramecium sonneborni]
MSQSPHKWHQETIDSQKSKMEKTVPICPLSSDIATLTLPNGKTVQLPIFKGTKGPPMIDITQLYSKSGYFTLDPGFSSTGACMSTMTYIDGDKGELLYRGYPIEILAKYSSYIEVCYLFIYGHLPSQKELQLFEETMVSEMMINEKLIEFYKGFASDSHPMAIMVGVVGALSAFMHKDFDVNDPRDREYIAIKLVAKMPTLAAYAYRTALGLPIVYPSKKYSFIENFLYMMFSTPMNDFNVDKVIVKALDTIFMLHADHEQNASTSTVRIAGSSLANPFACIAAGITALWGPYHGGANEAVLNMLKEIGNKENIPKYLQKAKSKDNSFRLMGFGHRVYKNYDPRAKVMQEMCYNVLEKTKRANDILELAIQLEQTALKEDYFIQRKLYPNVDFYTGIVYEALSIPTSMFTVMFAVQRSIGWICQWMEMMSEKVQRISRPRQLYVGEDQREYIPIQNRKEEEKSRVCKLPMHSGLFGLVKV